MWELSDDNKVFTMLNSASEHDDMTSSVSISSDKSRLLSASYDHTYDHCFTIQYKFGCS
jgi:hypothetical protein